ncbi:MAG: amino acid permease [Elusimicrobiota bacterium]|jgi:APA family basic amino acid/polyamine antiporter
MNSTQSAQIQEKTFRKELNLRDASMLVMGSMIGSGIFIVSADIARTVGGAGWILFVWALAGLLTVAAALSYGELAAMMPQAGGQYVYLREAWGPLAAFLYGWTFFLVIQTGTIAAVAVAFAKFAAVFIPALGTDRILFSAGTFKISAAQLVAVASIALLTAVNLRGLRAGKAVQNLFTFAKLAALFGAVAFLLLVGRDSAAMHANWQGAWNAVWTRVAGGKIVSAQLLSGWALLPALGAAMVGALFASDAWNNVTFTAGEMTDARRDLPLSLLFGTLAVTALYLLANIAYLCALPVSGAPEAATALGRGVAFAAEDRVAVAAISSFGPVAQKLLALLILVSTFGCNNGLILAGARALYAMAKDGLFFARAGTLNERSVPGTALVLQSIWAALLCLSGTYGDLLDYVIFAVLLFYILTILGVFVLRIKKPDAPRPYRAWGYPWVPALYVLCAAAICLDLLIFKPRYTWPGLALVVSGLPVYFLRKSRERAHPGDPSAGRSPE